VWVNLVQLNQRFEETDPADIVAWAVDRFRPRIAASSSFQTQSVALLHIISRVRPELPVLFIDTGYHFPETLAYRDQLIAQFGLNVQVIKRADDLVNRDQQGTPLYLRDTQLCCYVNKVEPMQQALAGLDAWVTGIRRDQTENRRNAQPVEHLANGTYKINPLVAWTDRDLWTYIHQHDLPVHPLFHQGYASVGCAPCTRPVQAGEDSRAGRWAGTNKTECGLHTDALAGSDESETKPGSA
jgi:phosphoadenosine phosphosulfate reductase